MCASYGLDPRFVDRHAVLRGDETLTERLRDWAISNAGATVRPTGQHMRNLNPILTDSDGTLHLENGWWGYLVDGQPAKFPSINTRSERLIERGRAMRGRALVPATSWFEMQKPNRRWFQLAPEDGSLFTMAAVTQRGRLADGEVFTCYSLVMRPAPHALANIHDRSPVLIPPGFADEWLTSDAPTRELVDGAVRAADGLLDAVRGHQVDARPS